MPRRDLVSALNGLMPLCRTIPGTHLRYTKVDERWMNTLSIEAIETGIDC